MSPAEKEVVEQAINQFLQGVLVLVVVGWWVWWAARKVGAGRLFSWPPAPAKQEAADAAQAHNRSSRSEPVADVAPLPPAQPQLQTPANVIAIVQNESKPPFAIAPEVQSLAVLLEVDGDILEQQLITLARLCDAEELGETAAIKIGLGIAPSGSSARYKAAKAALASLRRPARSEIVAVEPDPTTPHRSVMVRG